MLEERARNPFVSLPQFKARTSFDKKELRTLAEIGALNCLARHRRAAMWEVERPLRDGDLFGESLRNGADAIPSPLRPMDTAERLQADYEGLQLTTGLHPMALIRDRLPEVWRAVDL